MDPLYIWKGHKGRRLVIDPTNITNYNLTHAQLEEHILFWVCAAGKNGVTAANCLDKFLGYLERSVVGLNQLTLCQAKKLNPFALIRYFDEEHIVSFMFKAGIGCYTRKAHTFKSLAYNFSCNLEPGINLKTCTVEDLEAIKGIGPKTARCFLIHSRPNQRLAGLDVHILRFLADQGYKVPKSTPSSIKSYKKIEEYFLQEVDKSGKTVADFDLEVWNKYRARN